MTRVAAIDCGTNSIRLLVADADPGTGRLDDLVRRMEIVRLGQDVDRTGRLADAALARTFSACRDYASEVKRLGAERVRFVATSATRDAENSSDFVRGVLDILGVEPEDVSGDEEAALSFAGATHELIGQGDVAAAEDVVGDEVVFCRIVNVIGRDHAHSDPVGQHGQLPVDAVAVGS